MRSPRRALIEKLRAAGDEERRYVDCGARVRLYERGPDGRPVPSRWLPRAFGGVYDTFAGAYVPGRIPSKWVELKIHRGQLPLVEAIGDQTRRRILGLGAPGGGKSMAIVVAAVALALRNPNGIGGVVAPTGQRLEVVWRKLLELLEPAQFVQAVKLGSKELLLVNGTTIQFRAAARRSDTYGSPIAGHDWQWAAEDEQQNIDDDSLREVDARGRIVRHYQVFSSATNDARHEFQRRLQAYKASPDKHVVRFSGPDNCFTPLEHWEALKRLWSPEDYARFVDCTDVPRAGRVYPSFSYAENTARPPSHQDITAQLIADKYKGVRADYVVGWDPGVITSASVIMKAWPGQGEHERRWFVLDEVTTRDATTEFHAADIAKWCIARGIRQDRLLILRDPHTGKETDDSDDVQMRAGGFPYVRRSNYGMRIERKHRVSMVNALLRDATDRRRLFLASSPNGVPIADKTSECLGHLMYAPNGEVDYQHKTYLNLAHWGEAVGYALYPWENIRGAAKPAPAEPASVVTGPWRQRWGSS